MYFEKYMKYRNKNLTLGGNPLNDAKILDLNNKDILPINHAACNRIEKYDVSRTVQIRLGRVHQPREQEQTQEQQYTSPPITYFDSMIINRYPFAIHKLLGKGSFGVVVSYLYRDSQSGKIYGITVKYGAVNDDVNILRYIKERNICGSGYVNSFYSKYLDDQRNEIYFILMDYMDGTLQQYLEKTVESLNYEIIKKIFAKVVSQLYCLSKYGLFYTDIKTPNILYKCNQDDGIIDVLLGDIGSIVNTNVINRGPARASYPPPERCTPENCGTFAYSDDINSPPLNNKDVVWGCGILLLSMLRCYVENYGHKYIGKLSQEALVSEIDNSIKKAKSNLEQLVHQLPSGTSSAALSASIAVRSRVSSDELSILIDEILFGMLRPNPDDRVSLEWLYNRMKSIL
jgi:serine/threonine protein kinase